MHQFDWHMHHEAPKGVVPLDNFKLIFKIKTKVTAAAEEVASLDSVSIYCFALM